MRSPRHTFMRFGSAASLVGFLLLPGIALAAPARTPQDLLRHLPLRFEQDTGGRWASRGPGYSIRFDSKATALKLGDRTLRLSFAGSDARARFEASEPQKTATNYFIRRQYPSARGFSRLNRTGLYPGIHG